VIRRAAILIGVPVLIVALVAFPLGLWKGEYQWLCAGVAVGFVVPPGLVTLILAERLTRMSVLGPFLALALGTAVRVLVGFGGAVAVFFANKPTFSPDPFSFLGWVLGTYLTTLIVETLLLARIQAGDPAPPKV
jgi:hypothetical protein